LKNVNDVLQVLRERAVQSATDSQTADDREKVKNEVDQLKYQLVHLANSSYSGRYIFSGYSTDNKLLNDDGSYNVSVSSNETAVIKGSSLSFPVNISAPNNNFSIALNSTGPFTTITIPAAAYPNAAALTANITGLPAGIAVTVESGRLQFNLKDTTDALGNKQAIYLKSNTNTALQTIGFKTDAAGMAVSKSEDMNYLVSIGDHLNVNVPGTALFGAGIKGDTGDFMQKVNAFISALGSNDSAGLQQAIGDMDVLLDKSLSIQADIGARTNRVELTLNRLATDEVNFTELMSNNEDVDMAEVIMNLSNEENVYRSSLAAGAKIIMPTLLDFLR
jgi:flagellar hook-associated protein 3 FlgL